MKIAFLHKFFLRTVDRHVFGIAPHCSAKYGSIGLVHQTMPSCVAIDELLVTFLSCLCVNLMY